MVTDGAPEPRDSDCRHNYALHYRSVTSAVNLCPAGLGTNSSSCSGHRRSVWVITYSRQQLHALHVLGHSQVAVFHTGDAFP